MNSKKLCHEEMNSKKARESIQIVKSNDLLSITSILEPHNSQSGEMLTGAGEKTCEFPLIIVFTIG